MPVLPSRSEPPNDTRDWAVWDAEHMQGDRGRGVDDAMRHARGQQLSPTEASLESGKARRLGRTFPAGSPERTYHEGRAAGYSHHLAESIRGLSNVKAQPKAFDTKMQEVFGAARQRQLAKAQLHNLARV